ncbi:DUF6174 domain-containing protein [uncultured Serinicoccus sp.]|uniref:DUF6174 domain-containing protein n=1 Tax=uncultured Serinicoccus sp. TaxID=735514 RepID=UPI0026125181|nr:DUF6174 domain-containing protein [uncultured Serinicoccus sp.]
MLEPRVDVEADRVVIATSVEALSGGDCPANDTVPVQVDLGADALGQDLVDAACLEDGAAVGSTFCSTGPVRWHLPETGGVQEVPGWVAPSRYSYQVTSRCGLRAFIGTFGVEVSDGAVTRAVALDDTSGELALADAPTLEDILDEARTGVRSGRTVRVSLDELGDPRYVSVGDDLAQSDTTACYVIHELTDLGED